MKYRYVLFYRLEGERAHTAHMILVGSAREAKIELRAQTNVIWASLCNDKHEEFRTLENLK